MHKGVYPLELWAQSYENKITLCYFFWIILPYYTVTSTST
mgnify:CR=1 FL=1